MIEIAFKNLFKNKTRTIISLIGIIIGIASILTMVGVVDGLLYDVNDAVSQIQGVIIIQKGSMGPLFSQIDDSFGPKLEKIRGVKLATPTITTIAKEIEELTATDKSFGLGGVRLIGTDYSKNSGDTAAGIGGKIILGRNLTTSDKGKVVIGKELKDNLNKFVGNDIKINGEKFQIIGVYETGSQLLNSSILMSIDDLRTLISFPNNKVSQYMIELNNSDDDQKITDIINFRFGTDLIASSSSDFSAQLGDVLGSLRLLVIAVTAIAALIAGVGIINTMLMSVTERFKEIGALKATGWTNENIMTMILIEAAFIGVLGGILGNIVGILIGNMIQSIAGITVLITPMLAVQAFILAIILGLIGGAIPAYIASKLSPVDVLRMD